MERRIDRALFLEGEVKQSRVGFASVATCTAGVAALILWWVFVGHDAWKRELMTDLQAHPARLVETLSVEQLQILQGVVAQEMNHRRIPASENGEIVSK